MRRTVSLALAGMTLTLAFSLAAADANDWPIPQNTEEGRKARLFQIAWTKRTLAEPYETVGKKDPGWDGLVKDLMEVAVPLFIRPDDLDAHAKAYALAKRAIDAGCDDPIVLFIYAWTSHSGNFPGFDEYDRRITAASKALESSKYPAFRRAAALIEAGHFKLNRRRPSDRQEAKRCLDAALSLLLESVKTDGLTPYSQRFWQLAATRLFDSMKLGEGDMKAAFDKADAAFASVPAAKAIRLFLRGDFYIDYAWQARGSGYASSVTESGWRQFAERAVEARKALTEAWELKPGNSMAATRMITVELAIGHGNRVEMEKWFARAMEADNDNVDACYRKLYWLEPKWHGSREETLEFARACRDTKNVRSRIPFILSAAHRELADQLPELERVDYYKQPEVWDEIRGVYLDYLKINPDSDYFRSEYAGYCYLCGQYKEASAQFDTLGDRLVAGRAFSEKSLKEYRLSSAERVHGDFKPGVPLGKGFGVVEARYGANDTWVDVTRNVRMNVEKDRLKFEPAGLPDPIYGTKKSLATVYTVDGKVGLSMAAENQEVELPPKDGAGTALAAVPGQGFAVLAAKYGADRRWLDVTETLRKRIANGKLEASAAGLPDPAYYVHKSLVIVYSWDGKILLSIIPERQKVALPVVETAKKP